MQQAKKRYFRMNLLRTLSEAYESHGIKFIDEYETNLTESIRKQAEEDADQADEPV
jgi:hypothetical protein